MPARPQGVAVETAPWAGSLWRHVGLRHVLVLLAVLAYPWVATPFFTFQIGAQSLALGLVALSLTFLAGYGGMVSLAQMTVAGIAGYMFAIFATSGTDISLRWPWGLAVLLALVIATACGTLIGWFSVRTEGIYTIMITLAIGVAFYYLAQQNYSLFNGFQGFQSVKTPVVLGVDLRDPVPFYYLTLACALAGYLAVAYLVRAPFGVALQGIRDNPRRMSALGFDVTAHRVAAYAVAGLIAAVGGVLLVWYNGLISPGSVGTSWLINVLIIAVLGGMRHPDRAVRRRHRVRAPAELRRRPRRPGALQPLDRRRVPRHRAVLLRRPARMVGASRSKGASTAPSEPPPEPGCAGKPALERRRLRHAPERCAPGGPAADVRDSEAVPPPRPPGRIHREEGTMSSPKRQRTWVVVMSAILAVGAAASVDAQQTVKIGLLATLEGPFAAGGQDGMRGADLAVKQRGGMVAGKKIEVIKASSDAKPDVAVNATRKLVEQDKVDIMVGPLSGSEGIAVKNYSKSQPNVTFINGSSGAQATTLVDPSPNFFRFNTEGAQWMVGLGEYAFKDKGYKKMALIAEDYAFPYSQVQGFMTEYCKAGGRVTHKAWVPLGSKDYSSVIAKLPQDVDALLVVLGGADAVNFLTQYEQAGGNKPMVGGSITVDQTVLNFKGKRRESLLGTPSAGPIADSYDAPEWKKFVADYKENFKDGFPSPSLFAYVYYINMKAALDGLDAVKGDLSGGQAKYREALKNLKLKTPTGDVTLDENRQAIGTTFVTEVAKAADGGFYNKVVKSVPSVNQRLGMSKADFDKVGLGSRDVPNCP